MKAYSKGIRAEREILHFLDYKGFSVCRTPSSGGYITPADIIAMKRGMIIALECKNYANKPRLERKKLKRFREWCERAGAMGFLAWRNSGQWLFLRISDAERGIYEDGKWIEMKNLLSAFGIE
jgi:Holliday junction resolvase